jgi:methyl halide transferase
MGKDGIDWEQMYRDKFTPWDVKSPDSHLAEIVKNTPVKPCRALELGCGTGTNAIWLARQGFTVTALDLSETALEQARKKDGADACTFELADFFDDPLPGTDFGFVFDLGCMHGFTNPEHRNMLAGRVARCLSEGGCWLNLSSSLDGPHIGPNRLSAREITAAVEPYFQILSLTATVFDDMSPADREALGLPSGFPTPLAFSCLMRKRGPEDGSD